MAHGSWLMACPHRKQNQEQEQRPIGTNYPSGSHDIRRHLVKVAVRFD